ncbi:MAG: helix-turn-helix transcriptional regulator [Clostridia bacterium]|nr:helix-turn-helix transcriptional regulator [Clostridia bacterium]
MQPFVRYAAKSNYFISDTVQVYDCRLLYILSGKGTFETPDGEIPLTPNTLLYYPSGSIYRIFSDPTAPLTFYTVNFDFNRANSHIDHALLPVLPSEFREENMLCSKQDADATFHSAFHVKNASALKPDFDALVLEKEARVPLSDDLCSAYMQVILCKMLRLHRNTAPDDSLFMHVLNYIRANCNKPLNNKIIAEALGYHPNYLSALVKKTTGTSLHSYITDFRLHQAAGLLGSTRLSVAEIAEQCGFANANHFSALFKKHMGYSPLQYRNKA